MKDQLKIKLDKTFARYQQTPEIADLYEEVLTNLEAHTSDLIASGMDETLAVIKAFDEVGDLNEVLEELAAPLNKNDETKQTRQTGNHSPLRLVNEQVFQSVAFKKIKLNYKGDNLEILPSPDGQMHLLEYMNTSRADYFAQINHSAEELIIESGHRPKLFGILWPFRSKIIFLIPETDHKNLVIDSASGNLKISEVTLANLSVNLHSGNFNLAHIEADGLAVVINSGNTKCEQIKARNFQIQSGSGNLHFLEIEAQKTEAFSSSGNITIQGIDSYQLQAETKSGNLKVQKLQTHTANLKVHSGNVSAEVDVFTLLKLSSHSGNATVSLNPDASFYFTLQTGSGNTRISHPVISYKVKSQSYKTGLAGGKTERELMVETHSGNASVKSDG